MTWTAAVTLVVLATVMYLLLRELVDPATAMLGGLAVLLVFGILSPERALAGFASPAVALVATLSLVAVPLSESGFFQKLTEALFDIAKASPRPAGGFFQALLPVAALSAFVANTPLVAALIPALRQWARKNHTTASRFLMAVSFAAILGGMCTLVGTSTNLAVHGLLLGHGDQGLGFFEIGRVGLPAALLGLLFLSFAGPHLLPERPEPLEVLEQNPREYLVRWRVSDISRLAGKRVADYRRLPGLFLVAVERGAKLFSPASPDLELEQGDVLFFAGHVASIGNLASNPGLSPVPEVVPEHIAALEKEGHLVEAVVSPSSPLIGKNIRDANLRGRFDAVVLGVHRHGERLHGRIGDIIIRPGDTFLLLTGHDFLLRHRFSADFYLVSHAGRLPRKLTSADWIPAAVLAAIVVTAATGVLPILSAAVAGLLLLVLFRQLKPEEVIASLPISTLVTIAAAVSLGNAVVDSGLGHWGLQVLRNAGDHMEGFTALAVVIVATSFLTEFISNVVAASLLFPVAMELAGNTGIAPQTMAVAVALAASTSFLSPIGYHTNAMVTGPGGYKLSDFLRLGAPLKLITLLAILAGSYLLL